MGHIIFSALFLCAIATIDFQTLAKEKVPMKGHVINIEKAAIENNNFRKVLYTAENLQLVLMSLKPGEDIGEEVHQLDQFLRIESGEGKAILNGTEHKINDGFSVLVPAGIRHNLINTSSSKPLKIYTLYSPPNHLDGTIHKTKAEAEEHEEHFDGNITK